jgi:DNA-binding PadR family transcriptional regulator
MHQHHALGRRASQADLVVLAWLVHEPKTVTAWYEAVMQATGQVIEPGAFSRILVRLERRGWIEASGSEHPLRRYQVTEEGMLVLEWAERHQHKERLQEEGYPFWQRGRKFSMWLVPLILRLYPPAWRERYEAEMVALLEQHQMTLWTVLDLLVGALDARLDPNYRRAHQVLPLKRFKSSWRLLVAGLVAFWIALLPWFWLSQFGLDDADCSVWGGNAALCVLRKTLGTPQYSGLGLLVGLILLFLPILLMLFMIMLVVVRGKEARMHMQLAWTVAGCMILLSVVCGFWLAGIWQLLPQISRFYPQAPAGLIIGTIGMGLSTVLALGALARASSALREMEKAAPRQEAHLASTVGLSSSTSDHHQDNRYVEERRAEEPEEQQQEMLVGSWAAAPVREEPAAPFAAASGTRKGARSEWVGLLGLVLLFVVPWPALISGDFPGYPTLLFNLLLAVVVGLITAWLVKDPNMKREQRTRRKPRRPTSPLWWAAVLAAPAMTFFLFYIGHGPKGFLLLLLAGLVSGAVALIVKIRMGHPRIKSPLVLSLGVLVLATIFMALGVSHAEFFPQQSLACVVNIASISAAFFVKVPASSQRVEGESSRQDIGAGATPKVVGWVILLLACNAVFAELSSEFYLNQGQYPLPPWIGNEMLMSIMMAICLIPALVVKIQTSNRWAGAVREPAHYDISPRVWIMALPLLFLLCVTQMAYIIGSDAGRSFANVFISWLLTGAAALIMLLAIRLDRWKRMRSPEQEAPQVRANVRNL